MEQPVPPIVNDDYNNIIAEIYNKIVIIQYVQLKNIHYF